MEASLFNELVTSLNQAAEISRGEREAARETVYEFPDVSTVRRQLQMTPKNFAAMLNVSVRTVQSWEQGKSSPRGAARSLLLIASKYPQIVLETLPQSNHPTK